MKPTTISLLQKCKQEKKRFATITAYDYSFAKLFAEGDQRHAGRGLVRDDGTRT